MTTSVLLAYIVAALFVQVAIGLSVYIWRHRAAATARLAATLEAPPPASGGAWSGWREFRVTQRVFEDPACSQCSFLLAPVDGQPLPPFLPGQFLTFALALPAADAGGEPRALTRCYSLSDRPDPQSWRVTIRRVPAPADHPEWPPGLSSNHFHDHVRVGDVLRVKAPAGHFHIDPDPAVPVVLIAGGVGITPMMSMLRWCVAEQPGRTVRLYYGVRNGAEQAFKAALAQIADTHPNLHLTLVYSRPTADDQAGRDFQHGGHITLDLLRETLPHGRHQFYLCGPGALMDSLVPALAEWGVPAPDIHFEAFGPATVRLPAAAASAAPARPDQPIEVHLRRSGRTLSWDGSDANLLDFAERHGVAVDSGCRSGSCGACETRLLRGQVEYPHTPDHDIAAGHCLLCLGRPASPLELEA